MKKLPLLRSVGCLYTVFTLIISLFAPLSNSFIYAAEETSTQDVKEKNNEEEDLKEKEIVIVENDIEEKEIISSNKTNLNEETEIIIKEEENKNASVYVVKDNNTTEKESFLEESNQFQSEWEKNNDGSYTTREDVNLENEYVFPDDNQIKISFTRLSQKGKITIRKISLTEEEKINLNSIFDFSVEITSTMENGSFEYDLHLPRPLPSTKNDIDIMYSEDGQSNFKKLGDDQVSNNEIMVQNIDHFTVFVVVNPNPVNSNCSDAGFTVNVGDQCYNSIQDAINNASEGETINIKAGTYTENITIDKSVNIIGENGTIITQTAAGSGDTKVGVVQIEANNISLENLDIRPNGISGISIGRFTEATGKNISNLNINNVHVIGTGSNPCSEQERGFYVDLNSSLNNLSVLNSSFSNLTYGWYFHKEVGADNSTVSNVNVNNTIFDSNNLKGIYAEKLNDFTFTDSQITNNGSINNGCPFYFEDWRAGADINLKAGNYNNIVFNNPTITNNGIGSANGTGITVKGRDDGSYSTFTATVSNVQINEGSITGNENGIRIGEPGKNNATPTNVKINDADIFGNINFGLINETNNQVDATYNWWGNVNGPLDTTSGDGSDLDTNAGSGDSLIGNIDYNPWVSCLVKTVHNIDTGEDFCTIQNAIDDNDTLNNHTITVEDGTYNEKIVINKSLKLEAINPGNVLIDADTGFSGLTFGIEVKDNPDNITIDGFDIWTGTSHGNNASIGIYGQTISGNLTIKNCDLSRSTGQANVGGLRITQASDGTPTNINEFIFDNNTVDNNIYGLYALSTGVTINDIQITNSNFSNQSTYGIQLNRTKINGTLSFDNNIIDNNNYGFSLDSSPARADIINISNSEFTNNNHYGFRVHSISNISDLNINNNIFAGNPDHIRLQNGPTVFNNVLINNNDFTDTNRAIYVQSGVSFTENSIVVENNNFTTGSIAIDNEHTDASHIIYARNGNDWGNGEIMPNDPNGGDSSILEQNNNPSAATVNGSVYYANRPPVVTVNYPNGGEYFAGGNTETITWSATDADNDSLTLKLEYSLDNGNTWIQVNGFDGVNDGSFDWLVPVENSTEALIKLTADDSFVDPVSDESDNVFTIDSIAPIVTITNPADTDYIKANADLRVTIEDINLLRYYYRITDWTNTVVTSQVVNRNTPLTDETFLNWDTTSVPDGEYTIHVAARDQAMNRDANSEDQINVFVDNTAPEITNLNLGNSINHLNNSTVFSGNINDPLLTDGNNGSGVKSIRVRFRNPQPDNSLISTCWATINADDFSFSIDTGSCNNAISDGIYDIVLRTRDNLNNQKFTRINNITVDNIAPETDVYIQGDLDEAKDLQHNNGWHGYGWYESFDNVNLQISNGDTTNDFIHYQILNNDSICPVIGDVNYSIVNHNTNINSDINGTDGLYTLCYYGEDSAGNTESDIHKELLHLDDTNPSFTITGATGLNMGNYYLNNSNNIEISLDVSDNLSGYTRGRYDKYIASDNTFSDCTHIQSNQDNLFPPSNSASRTFSDNNLTDGYYCYRVWTYDDVQNKSWTDTNGNQWVYFEIDTTPPVITIDPLLTSDRTPELTGTVNDVNALIKITVNGIEYDAINNGNGTWTLPNNTTSSLADGIYDVQAKAIDLASNEGFDSTVDELEIETIKPEVLDYKLFVYDNINNNWVENYYVKACDRVKISVKTTDDSGIDNVEFRPIRKNSGEYIDSRVFIDSVDTDGLYSYEFTIPCNGEYINTHNKITELFEDQSAWFRVRDNAGNYSDPHNGINVLFTYDNSKPWVDPVLRTIATSEGSNMFDVNIEAHDDSYIDKICFRAEDSNGNEIVSETCYNNGQYGNGDQYNYTWTADPSEWFGLDYIDTSVIPEGVYKIDYWVLDSAGNQSDDDPNTVGDQPYSIRLTILNVEPEITFNSNQTITQGEKAIFSGSFTDPSYIPSGNVNTPDDSPWTVSIDYGDGNGYLLLGTLNNPNETINIPDHQYNNSGNFTANLKVCEFDNDSDPDNDSNPNSEERCSVASVNVTVNKKGCTNPDADNYDPSAVVDDGSCYISGCTDSNATNYNPIATKNNGTCIYASSDPIVTTTFDNFTNDNIEEEIKGCMDENATNYNPEATISDDSCEYEEDEELNNQESANSSGEVKGADNDENDTCEENNFWWWFPLVLQIIFIGILYIFVQSKSESNNANKWYLIPIIALVLSLFAHMIWNCNCATSVACNWYWLYAIIISSIGLGSYYYKVEEKQTNNNNL